MAQSKQGWTFMGVGALGLALGISALLLHFELIPIRGKYASGVAEWLLLCVGIVFAGVGLVFALTGFEQIPAGRWVNARAPAVLQFLKLAAALGAIGSLAIVASYAAFVPGPRQFEMALSGDRRWSWMPELLGRIFFGMAAVVTWAVFLLAAFFGLKGLLGRK